MTYAVAEPDVRYRLAATADSKTDVVVDLVRKHTGTPTLVIGQYVDQLEELAQRLDAALITGDTTVRQRERLYEAFRTGEIDLLVVSKVANFSIDLPERAGRDPGLRRVRLPAGGGAAPRSAAAPQGGRRHRPLLRRGQPRHRRRRVRRAPPALPGRAGLRLHDHGRRRRAGRRLAARGVGHPRGSGHDSRPDSEELARPAATLLVPGQPGRFGTPCSSRRTLLASAHAAGPGRPCRMC